MIADPGLGPAEGEWIDEFEIDRIPATFDAFWDWHRADRQPASEGDGWFGAGVSDQEAAARYCKSRGLELPTYAEWQRAARGLDGAPYEWGEPWIDRPRCVDWDRSHPTTTICRWTNRAGLQFVLYHRAAFGEWTAARNCPLEDELQNPRPIGIDPSGSIVPPDYVYDGLIRCVRHRHATPPSSP